MTDGKNRQWILNARPAGKLTGKEFLWNEAPIPRPSNGQILIRTLWLSIDPVQRIWMARDSYKPAVPLGDVMQSFAVGQVLESRLPDFKRGDLVRGEFGWQDYAVTDGKSFGEMQKVPPGIPPNLALGLFGPTGGRRISGSRRSASSMQEKRLWCRAPPAPRARSPARSPSSKLPRHRHGGRQGKVRLAG